MRILIIDSSKDIISRLEEMFQEMGSSYQVKSTVSYKEALPAFHLHQPEIVLIGLTLPVNESLYVLKDIQAAVGPIAIFVLFISLPDYLKEEGEQRGITHFIDKYRDFERLPLLIKALIPHPQSQI